MISVDKLMRNNSRFSSRCGWTTTRGCSTCIVQTSSTLRLAPCPTDSSSNRLVIFFCKTKNITTYLKDLQCKPFSWFLKNVYPEKFILDDPKHVFAYGRLKNPTSNTCLDNLQVSLLKWSTIFYLCHSPWTLCRTTTRTPTTWANMLVTTSWPVHSSSLSPRSEMIWIVVIWFRTMLLWGVGKQTKASTCEGTSCVEKTIALKCPLRSHNDMRRCRPNLTLSYCAYSFSVSAIFLNFLIIFLLNWFSAAFLNFLTIFLSPWIADNLSHQVEMATCHGQGGEQDWAHTKEGKIIHKARVQNLRWKSSHIKRIFVQETKKCLDAGRGQSMDLLYVAPCQNIPSQVEHWKEGSGVFSLDFGTFYSVDTVLFLQVWYFDHYLN